MLEVNNLKLSFGEREVLKGISFEIRLGQIVGLFGKTSSGKSQIFETVLNLKNFTAGTVIYENKKVAYNINEHIVNLRQQIGYVPQYKNFLDFGNLFENLTFISNKKSDQIIYIASLLEFTDSLYKNIDEVESEDLFRAKIGLALLKSPKIILIDEPLAYLNEDRIETVLKFIEKIFRDKKIGVLISSQSENLSKLEIFDKKLFLNNGVINEL